MPGGMQPRAHAPAWQVQPLQRVDDDIGPTMGLRIVCDMVCDEFAITIKRLDDQA